MKSFEDEPMPEDPIIVAEREDTTEDVDRIQQLLKELDLTGGVARIFRQKPGKADFDYEGELPVDNFSLETIKRVYGGGRYQIRLTAKGGKYVKQIKFSIDPRHVGEMDRINQTPNAVIPTSDNSNLITFLLKAQQDSQDRAQQQQAAMMTLMVTMMTESQKATAQMMSAAFHREPINVTPEPASRLMEVMMPMLIAQMQAPKSNNLSDLVESLKVVKELATGQPEKEEREEDMLDKIVKVGAPLLGAFMSRNQPMPTPAPVAAPNPQQRPQIPVQQEDPKTAAAEAKMRSLLGQLRMVTPILVRAAKKDSPIESYLDILDDTLDEEGFQMLAMFLQRDDWVSTLFNDDPGVRENIGWFDNFRAMVLNPETDEPTEETAKVETPKASSPFGVVRGSAGSPVDGDGN
jgi:hypothetical protein